MLPAVIVVVKVCSEKILERQRSALTNPLLFPRFPDHGNKIPRPPGQLRPVGFLEDWAGDEQGTQAHRDAAGPDESSQVIDARDAGWDDAQMRQGRANRANV